MIDTSNIKSIRIDKGEPVIEMYDKQKAMQVLLDRLNVSENTNDGLMIKFLPLKKGEENANDSS